MYRLPLPLAVLLGLILQVPVIVPAPGRG